MMSLDPTRATEWRPRYLGGTGSPVAAIAVVWLVAMGILVAGSEALAQCGGGSKSDEPPVIVPAKPAEQPKTAEQPKAGEDAEKSEAGTEKRPAGPRWRCDQPVVAPDPVWRGVPITCRFEFRNDGSKNLRVSLAPS